jgi:hypothetical protein
MKLEGWWVWCLDPVNSPELISRLRSHGRDRQFEVAWVGERWRDLVATCHARLERVFPDYDLLSVKQKFGVLRTKRFRIGGSLAKLGGRHRNTAISKRSRRTSGSNPRPRASGAARRAGCANGERCC